MEPLGISGTIISIEDLPKWSQTVPPDYEILCTNPNALDTCPFKVDEDINNKIILWYGDITNLNCHAIVNSTSENFNDKSPLCQQILNRAGREIYEEIKNNIKICKTGDSKITKGYNLPCRSVIHTVGPRYNIKYKTAAESALFNCYRSILALIKEHNIISLALPCIHSSRRGYPSFEGAHIALRTIRRFLETNPSQIECIAFVVAEEDDKVYNSLMPLYFPRNRDEAIFSGVHLPCDTGSNKTGEPIIIERAIRIEGKPQLSNDLNSSVDINKAFDVSVAVGRHPFSKPQINPDKRRICQDTSKEVKNEQEKKIRYVKWLTRSKTEDLYKVERLRWLYHCGYDRCRRPVIVVIGKHLKPYSIDNEKIFLHLIKTMDEIVTIPFVVVYFHTLAEKNNLPDTEVVKESFNILDKRYKENMHALYILHTSTWSKVQTWIFSTFNLSEIKKRIVHLPGLEYLYSRIGPDQLNIPSFILDYDIATHGTRYYNPEQDETFGLF